VPQNTHYYLTNLAKCENELQAKELL